MNTTQSTKVFRLVDGSFAVCLYTPSNECPAGWQRGLLGCYSVQWQLTYRGSDLERAKAIATAAGWTLT